jgi:large subunit ribosomal protein L10
VGTGFALGEAPPMAKALMDFAKGEDMLSVKGGIMDSKMLTAQQIEDLANLPSLDQLRAQILGLINGPAQGIVSAVANGVRQVINVVDAYAKSGDEEGEAEVAA